MVLSVQKSVVSVPGGKKQYCSGLQGFGFVATRFEELLIESQDHRFIRIPEGSVKLE